VDRFFPDNLAGKGSIIVTTQKAHMSPLTRDFFKMPLDSLPEDNGSQLLFKIYDKTPKDG
jgi:hypothetical protein